MYLISWNNSWKNNGNARGGLGRYIYIYGILDWESKATRRQQRFELAGRVGRATVWTMREYFGQDDTRFPPEVRTDADIDNFLLGKLIDETDKRFEETNLYFADKRKS